MNNQLKELTLSEKNWMGILKDYVPKGYRSCVISSCQLVLDFVYGFSISFELRDPESLEQKYKFTQILKLSEANDLRERFAEMLDVPANFTYFELDYEECCLPEITIKYFSPRIRGSNSGR